MAEPKSNSEQSIASPPSLIRDPDSDIPRCWWCGGDPQYVRYHDEEWGVPVDDDRRLFEKICLEGFQAGLSWLTILRRREAFRSAFANFEVESLVRFETASVDRLAKDASIIRHRGKIKAVLNNAQRALELVEEYGSLANFVWQHEPREPALPPASASDIPAVTAESTAMSRELKRRGWSFVGPTTCYAFMQSMGLVNDHLRGCQRRESIDNARHAFVRPNG